MPTSKVSWSPRYAPKTGDWIFLPYANAKKALFDPAALPKEVRAVLASAPKKGGLRTVFCGTAGRVSLQVRTVRLDGETASPVESARRMAGSALAAAEKEGGKRAVILLDGGETDLLLAAQEGALLGAYAFDTYLERKARPLPLHIVTTGRASRDLSARRAAAATVCEWVNFARDLMNEPPNRLTPPVLGERFRAAGRKAGLRVQVWDEKKLARERCGGILGVGQGADVKPRLVIGEYRPRGAKRHLCLVGKGVTFDSGGYCLKPSASQIGMKYDMGGAAMMFAAACAVARRKLPIRLTVLTPLAENDISGHAIHTTSILTTRAGRTVEVENTDAEGRIILADALTLAVERKPDWIIDAATLTGACCVALGEDIAGLFGTEEAFTRAFRDAGAETGERFWELPLHMPYAEHLKSTIADIKNTGSRWGGAIAGALFLRRWVPDKQAWIHCDIAGPGCKEERLDHLGKGAKGFGVKTVVRFAETHCRRGGGGGGEA